MESNFSLANPQQAFPGSMELLKSPDIWIGDTWATNHTTFSKEGGKNVKESSISTNGIMGDVVWPDKEMDIECDHYNQYGNIWIIDLFCSELHERLQLELVQFVKNVEKWMKTDWRWICYHNDDDKNVNEAVPTLKLEEREDDDSDRTHSENSSSQSSNSNEWVKHTTRSGRQTCLKSGMYDPAAGKAVQFVAVQNHYGLLAELDN